MVRKLTVDLPFVTDNAGRDWGYDGAQLAEWMQAHGKGDVWKKWSHGNTCAVIDGTVVVYWWDAQDFLDGLRNLD